MTTVEERVQPISNSWGRTEIGEKGAMLHLIYPSDIPKILKTPLSKLPHMLYGWQVTADKEILSLGVVGSKRLGMRLDNKPDLAALVANVIAIESVFSGIKAINQRVREEQALAERERITADMEAYRQSMPEGMIELDATYDAGAADGWGHIAYASGGESLPASLHGLEKKIFGNHEIVAYAPKASIAEALATISARQAQRHHEQEAYGKSARQPSTGYCHKCQTYCYGDCEGSR